MKSSLRHYGLCKILVLIVAAVITSGCFFSCSKKVSVSSLTSTLDEIDRYINQGQVESALKLLDKTDNKSLSSTFRLGICRRYLRLGETKKAEGVVKSAIKNDPENLQLTAVYTSILLKKDDLKEAMKTGKKLSGTEYGSLYAEALLKSKVKSGFAKVTYDDFCSEDYSGIYFDAYAGSKDNRWLRNNAIVSLTSGKINQAFVISPREYQSAQDAYFWALVKYDNRKFVDAAEDFKAALDLAEREMTDDFDLKKNLKKKQNLSLKARALLADCYVNLAEEKLAEKERSAILEYLTARDDDENSAEISDSEYSIPGVDILSVIYLNSAVWAQSRDDAKGAYKLLLFEVSKWPDYVPGLITYGNYAYNSSLLSLDDPMTQELRKLGICSMDMEAYDDIPKIPVEDAIARMDDSLNRFKNYQLYVAKLDLEDKIQNITDKAYLAKIYTTLEKNTLGTNLYPPEIVRYAVHGFLSLDRKEEAEELFNRYISTRYKFNPEEPFYDEFFHHIHELQNWEIENAAWFVTEAKRAGLARQLYDFIVFVEYVKDSKTVREVSPRASASAKMNLAMIYSSTGNKNEALSLYGKAASDSQDLRSKSEALYRIGVLYNDMNKVEDAIKSLKYAIYLNPSHSKARLLLSKIRN